jgi:hypothetical protein
VRLLMIKRESISQMVATTKAFDLMQGVIALRRPPLHFK